MNENKKHCCCTNLCAFRIPNITGFKPEVSYIVRNYYVKEGDIPNNVFTLSTALSLKPYILSEQIQKKFTDLQITYRVYRR